MLPAEQQLAILQRGVEEIIPREELAAKLRQSCRTGRPLVIKEGFDPTAPELHLGHTISLRKLRDFQRLGHDVVFLIGDFTGRIGDPSGRTETRQQLGRDEVLANAETYKAQVFKILSPESTRIEFNSKWCEPMRFEAVLDLASRTTVARLLERDDFRRRFEAQKPISLLEFIYPLVQAYDSVALRADVEVGGTDQKWNLLVGRQLQRDYGLEPQVVMTLPLLPGTDGVEKMSKSLGNHIGIHDPPAEMFGKLMSIPDAVLMTYLLLLSDLPTAELEQRQKEMAAGRLNPVQVKRELGRELVRQYHGEAASAAAEAAFDRVFVRRELPEEMLEVRLQAPARLIEVMVRSGLVQSLGEARRLVRQGAVLLDGEPVADEAAQVEPGESGQRTLKVGKRRFARVLFPGAVGA